MRFSRFFVFKGRASCRRFSLLLSRDPIVHELSRRLVAVRGVAATPIVERLDVSKEICHRFVPRRVTGAMHPLVLQAVEEAFGWCKQPLQRWWPLLRLMTQIRIPRESFQESWEMPSTCGQVRLINRDWLPRTTNSSLFAVPYSVPYSPTSPSQSTKSDSIRVSAQSRNEVGPTMWLLKGACGACTTEKAFVKLGNAPFHRGRSTRRTHQRVSPLGYSAHWCSVEPSSEVRAP